MGIFYLCTQGTFDENQIGGKSHCFQAYLDVKFYTTLCSTCVLCSPCGFFPFFSTVKSFKHDGKRKMLLSINLLSRLQNKCLIWDSKISNPKWTSVKNITQTGIIQDSLHREDDTFLCAWCHQSLEPHVKIKHGPESVQQRGKCSDRLIGTSLQELMRGYQHEGGRWINKAIQPLRARLHMWIQSCIRKKKKKKKVNIYYEPPRLLMNWTTFSFSGINFDSK